MLLIVAKLKWVQYEIPPSGPFYTIMLFDGQLWRVLDISCAFQSLHDQLYNWNEFYASTDTDITLFCFVEIKFKMLYDFDIT